MLQNQPQPFHLPFMLGAALHNIDARGLYAGVAQQVGQLRQVLVQGVKGPGKQVPISYNKGKTRNPSKIKGFRACPYSFSKNITLRSRSKGGVEKQELKLWTKI